MRGSLAMLWLLTFPFPAARAIGVNGKRGYSSVSASLRQSRERAETTDGLC